MDAIKSAAHQTSEKDQTFVVVFKFPYWQPRRYLSYGYASFQCDR